MSETGMRVYELGYLLVPTTPETEVSSLVEKLSKTITDIGGTVHTSGSPEFIDLAYTIEKNVASKKLKWSQGYFGWVKFEAAPEAMDALKKSLDANLDVMRYLITKTTLDNSITFKKPKIEAKRILAEEEGIFEEEVSEEDMKSDHELLPDLEADIIPEIVEEKEEE